MMNGIARGSGLWRGRGWRLGLLWGLWWLWWLQRRWEGITGLLGVGLLLGVLPVLHGVAVCGDLLGGFERAGEQDDEEREKHDRDDGHANAGDDVAAALKRGAGDVDEHQHDCDDAEDQCADDRPLAAAA